MMKRKCSKIFLLTSLLLTLALALIGCSKEAADTGNSDVTRVKVSSVNMSSLQSNIEYGSKLAASTEIQVVAKVSGKIDSINTSVGREVKKGEVLAVVDSKELQAQYKQYKGSYDSANANYVKTSDSSYTQQLQQAKTSLESARLQYDNANSNLKRVQSEYNIGDVTKEELEAAQLKVNNAASQLDAARDALELLQTKSGPQANAAAAAQVSQAQGSLELIELQLKDTVITAPVDGVIAAKSVEVGNTVSSGTSIFTIIENNSLIAEVYMTDKNVVKVQEEQQIPVKVDALGDKSFEGVVDSVSPTADSKTQLYSVRVRVDNKDNALKAGMIARLNFINEKRDSILAVPKSAIFIQNSVSYVYTVQDSKVKKIEVETGISNSSQIEVKKGVEQGDYVVIEGQNFLEDEQNVTISE